MVSNRGKTAGTIWVGLFHEDCCWPLTGNQDQGFEEIFQDMIRICIRDEKELSLGGDTMVLAWQPADTAPAAHVELDAESLLLLLFMPGRLKTAWSSRATG